MHVDGLTLQTYNFLELQVQPEVRTETNIVQKDNFLPLLYTFYIIYIINMAYVIALN